MRSLSRDFGQKSHTLRIFLPADGYYTFQISLELRIVLGTGVYLTFLIYYIQVAIFLGGCWRPSIVLCVLLPSKKMFQKNLSNDLLLYPECGNMEDLLQRVWPRWPNGVLRVSWKVN